MSVRSRGPGAHRSSRWTLLGVSLLVLVAVALLSGGFSAPWPPSDLVLAEIVASNATTLTDEDGDHSDWIELHNPTDAPVDLDGYGLTRGRADEGWRLPPRTLAPDERLVVFASGKDRAPPEGELHTDFRLPAAGTELQLISPDGRGIADRFPPVELPRDASYGRAADAPWRTCWFAFPSPGSANTAECFEDPDLGAPTFSVPSGFHDGAITLAIEPANDGATIHYTLDGSYPDPDRNPATRTYDAPLHLDDPTGDPLRLAAVPTSGTRLVPWVEPSPDDVPRAVVVRARTEGSRETAATYLIGDRHPTELPVLSLLTDAEHLFDPVHGIYVPGTPPALTSDEVPEAPRPHRRNHDQRGRAWERPLADDLRRAVILEHCHVEVGCDHRREVGVRVHGGFTRALPQKSLRLYARNDYGERTFSFPFFGEDGPVGHRRLLLRNSGNDWGLTMLLDGVLHDLVAHLDLETQAYRPVVLYLSGEYWGIHNLRERYDRHYLEAVHGLDPDDLVVVDTHLQRQDGPLGSGVTGELRDLVRWLEDADPDDPAVRARLEAAFDLDSLLDWFVVQVFTANDDAPNNVRLWRTVSSDGEREDGLDDGRWRWLLFDLDHLGGGLGRHAPGLAGAVTKDEHHDLLAELVARRQVDPTRFGGVATLARWLVADDEVFERFAVRLADHLNTTWRPDRTLPALAGAAARIEGEIPRHAARWGAPTDVETWRGHVDELARFLEARHGVQWGQLGRWLGRPGSVQVRVEQPDPGRGTVRLNSLLLAEGQPGIDDPAVFEGRYPAGLTLHVRAEAAVGHRFVGWQARGLDLEDPADSHLRVALADDVVLVPRFEPTS
jgi:hypothetical protein